MIKFWKKKQALIQAKMIFVLWKHAFKFGLLKMGFNDTDIMAENLKSPAATKLFEKKINIRFTITIGWFLKIYI